MSYWVELIYIRWLLGQNEIDTRIVMSAVVRLWTIVAPFHPATRRRCIRDMWSFIS